MLFQKFIAGSLIFYQGLMAISQMMNGAYIVLSIHIFIAFFIYTNLYKVSKVLCFADWGFVVSIYLFLFSIAAFLSGSPLYNVLFFSGFAALLFGNTRRV